MEKLRPEVVNLVSGQRMPGPKDRSGVVGDLEARRPPHPPPNPALPVQRRLQTDWLYSWTRGAGRRPGPPTQDTLTRGVGDSPCHNHDTRRPRLDWAG